MMIDDDGMEQTSYGGEARRITDDEVECAIDLREITFSGWEIGIKVIFDFEFFMQFLIEFFSLLEYDTNDIVI